MMMEMGADTPEALRYLAEDSGNVDDSGNFSIQVRAAKRVQFKGATVPRTATATAIATTRHINKSHTIHDTQAYEHRFCQTRPNPALS